MEINQEVLTRNYYMVRMGRMPSETLNTLINNGVVAVGWSKVEFDKYDSSREVRERVDEVYYLNNDSVAKPVKGKKLNEVERFCNIKEGDYIIIPYYSRILLAVATSIRKYDIKFKPIDVANQIEVNYQRVENELKTVERKQLTEALQRRLLVMGTTVSNLCEFKDEIEKLFNDNNYKYKNYNEKREEELVRVVKNTLLNNIINGKTNLQTSGIGLENLVRELFECEGYKASICAKTKFTGTGDADVEATKCDRFLETKVFVQVKHHGQNTNIDGINQLNAIKNSGEYSGYKYIFITTANIPDDVKRAAEDLDIIYMDGNELMDWLFDNINKLSDNMKIRLGITSVPQLI